MDAKNGKETQRPTYLECPNCGKTNHPVEKCLRRDGAHVHPERTKHDAETGTISDKEENPSKAEKPTLGQMTSKTSISKKELILPRLQKCDRMSVRQYVISDPSNVALQLIEGYNPL